MWTFRKCGWNEFSTIHLSGFHILVPYWESPPALHQVLNVVAFLTCWTSWRSGCKGHVCCGVYFKPNPCRTVQSFHCTQSTLYKRWRSSIRPLRNEPAAGCCLHRHPLSSLSKNTWTVVHACSKLLAAGTFQGACILLPLPGSHMLTMRQVICCQTSLCQDAKRNFYWVRCELDINKLLRKK